MHVIYGGTFDPIHHGHLRLAVELRERLGVSEVSLMPCHVPPHRDLPGASSEQRLALLELAISGEPGLTVDDRELRRNGASYTAETLRRVRRELGPEQPLTMVLGTDSFAGFDRWQEWQCIPQLAHIVVVRRPGPGLAQGSVPAQLLAQRAVAGVDALYSAPSGH
ncbi:MAG TPA: nicotinate-nucleotide adenylyltransferase, partial [Thioalkalivibrio sp.]|nr:nicotinate-nucleotide adenylyltransferase [Thioalkalivibrio sp.]